MSSPLHGRLTSGLAPVDGAQSDDASDPADLPCPRPALRFGDGRRELINRNGRQRRRSPVTPGELLFDFHVERTRTFWRVELRDHGNWARAAPRATILFSGVNRKSCYRW